MRPCCKTDQEHIVIHIIPHHHSGSAPTTREDCLPSHVSISESENMRIRPGFQQKRLLCIFFFVYTRSDLIDFIHM